MLKSERKNRSGDRINYNTSPNQEKRTNPPKKSRTDEPQLFENPTGDNPSIFRGIYYYI